ARPPGGRPDTVRKLTAEQVMAYRAERLAVQNVSFAVVGPTTPAAVVEALDSSPLAEMQTSTWRPVDAARAQTPRGRDPVWWSVPWQYAYVALAVEGFAFDDSRSVVADVIAALLCHSSASLLYEQVRERLGLSYAVDGWHRPYTDTGMFRIVIGTLPEHAA